MIKRFVFHIVKGVLDWMRWQGPSDYTWFDELNDQMVRERNPRHLEEM